MTGAWSVQAGESLPGRSSAMRRGCRCCGFPERQDAAVQTSVTWWHAPKDANAPLSAARRVVGHLPNARLITFSENEGHLAGYHRQGEILDELLARG